LNDYSYFTLPTKEIVTPAARGHANDWRLLRRLVLPPRMNEPQGGTIKRALVLDVETTGLTKEDAAQPRYAGYGYFCRSCTTSIVDLL
jgi:DNA polymerase-3 subunit epsilon